MQGRRVDSDETGSEAKRRGEEESASMERRSQDGDPVVAQSAALPRAAIVERRLVMKEALRIVILEDHSEDAELILRELKRGNICPAAKWVTNKNDFLQALGEFEPDLVLSDHNLPGFTGIDALKLARARYNELPFILVTGALGEELAVETIKKGATDYIPKHRLGQLVPAIMRAIREAEQRAQRRQAEELLKDHHEQLIAQNIALQQSEQRFRQLAENIREVFWMTDPTKNQMIYISPGYEQIWGRSCQSLYDSPRTWMEAIHPDDRERVYQAALTQQVAGEYHQVYRILRPDGSLRWIQDRAFPIRNETGQVYRIAGIAEDITVAKTAEGILRESEEKFRTLFESAPVSVALHSADGKYVHVNRAYQNMLGYKERELCRLGAKRVTHPDDVAEGQRLFNQLRHGNIERYQREKRYLHKNGRLVWAQSHASAVRDQGGELKFIISMVEDITERKQMEQEILESITNERRRIGHDLHDGLCQYLSGIAFRAKALEQDLARRHVPESSEAGELVGLLQKAISQTRSLARGFDPIEVEHIGLPAALQNLSADTEKFFDIRCSFRGPRGPLRLEPQTALALYRIAQEAIHNAIKHGDARRVAIHLGIQGKQLCLRIEDNGVGFEPGKESDTGMGLRVMRYRARSIGGNFQINSRLKEGTEIQCVVPCRQNSNGV